jgi:hypothetical protein
MLVFVLYTQVQPNVQVHHSFLVFITMVLMYLSITKWVYLGIMHEQWTKHLTKQNRNSQDPIH